MNLARIFITTLALSAPVFIFSQNKDLLGVWLSENKKQKIFVYYNKATKKYNGRIAWMYEDDQANGRKMYDVNNTNPKLRTRRITGIDLLTDFEQEDTNEFFGKIYDPVSGKFYKCNLEILPGGKTAKIRGYIFHPIFGRTEIATKLD